MAEKQYSDNPYWQSLRDFYNEVGKRLTYKVPVIFIALTAFLYSMTQQTLSVDDLRRDYYYGEHGGYWFGRWGCILWARLMGVTPFASFVDRFFSMTFLVMAGVLVAAIFYVVIRRNGFYTFREAWPYTVLTCGIISYPLINEEWEYTLIDFCMTGNLMLCGFALLYLVVYGKRFVSWRQYVIPTILLLLSASGYETGSFYYVSLACMVLFFRYAVCGEGRTKAKSRRDAFPEDSRQEESHEKILERATSREEGSYEKILEREGSREEDSYEKILERGTSREEDSGQEALHQNLRQDNKTGACSTSRLAWLWEGIHYAIPLAVGLALRYAISGVVNGIAGKQFFGGGDTAIKWGSRTVWDVFRLVFTNYAAKALIYFPITVFVILALVFVLYCVVLAIRRRSFAPVGLGLLVFVSLFLLSLVKGDVQPYRTSQTLSAFAGFVLFLVTLLFADRREDGTVSSTNLFDQEVAYRQMSEDVSASKVPFGAKVPAAVNAASTGTVSLSNPTQGTRRWNVRRRLYAVSIILCMVLCVHMAAWMNWILSLNHQRSQNEEAMVYQIGYRLVADYPVDQKPVVFVGWENLGSAVEGKVRADANRWNGNWYIRLYRRLWHTDPVNLRGPETNVNSVITWSRQTNDMMYELFRFHGFDLNIASWGPNQELFAQAEQIREDQSLGPYDIVEEENYILVCLNYFPNEF